MAKVLKEIGAMFKEKRKEMHLSLKEVENATSIRMNYLQAIEDGKIDKFLSRVYVLGFVRQYASFLGYDGAKIIKENPEAFRLPLEKQEFAYGIGTLDVRGSPSGTIRWLPNFLWMGIGLISLVLCWAFAKFLGIF